MQALETGELHFPPGMDPVYIYICVDFSSMLCVCDSVHLLFITIYNNSLISVYSFSLQCGRYIVFLLSHI